MNNLHDKNLPNESSEYRIERNKLLEEEIKLRTQVEKVAVMRRNLPPGGQLPQDYQFTGLDEDRQEIEVRLSGLFGKNDTLIVYSFMYAPEAENPCAMCTSIIDALNSNAEAIGQRASIAVVAKSEIVKIANIAEQRGWHTLRLLSSGSNTYNKDYYAEDKEGNQWPICNVFVRRGEEVFHTYATELLHVTPAEGEDARHMDFMWPLYNYLDLTPEGRGGWYPKLSYDQG
jgi:predicted dithiol-disulfide oxidoreductase (DUF899 family)